MPSYAKLMQTDNRYTTILKNLHLLILNYHNELQKTISDL